MTSRGAEWTLDTAPPVQYIHIPKAGGTTVQASLRQAISRFGRSLYVTNAFSRTTGCHKDRDMAQGQYYAGHSSIGFFSKTFRKMSPIYIVVTREPIALMVSLYDFIATYASASRADFTKLVHEYRDREDGLAKEGVQPDMFLDTLLQRNLDFVNDFRGFYVPCDCDHSDPSNLTTSAMHNLLRVDVVVVLEEFGLFVPQIEHHLPWLRPFTVGHSHNKARRPPQQISQETLGAFMRSERYETQARLYQFAKTVARARAEYATACLSGNCPSSELVPIELALPDFTDLLATRDALRHQSACLVPPADGQAWPTFVW
eukprot:CAMPEP_0198659516 /NCGR_PEP_ID=MMETSP1467-20131203/32317_1 /TAXON_ID=1462469 /ORGANISM="unid. sp., Strain CCMP2135" /LENGTH=315 /DNA_ID=CAMNT_0044395871 /DNA_START=88 /DNA_END=1035 /DNA_ORIENTATION=+